MLYYSHLLWTKVKKERETINLKKVVVIWLFVSILTGCSNASKAYESAMNAGEIALIEKDYNRAREHFERASEYKTKRNLGKDYQQQMEAFMLAKTEEDSGNYVEALALYEEVMGYEFGSNYLSKSALTHKKAVLALKHEEDEKKASEFPDVEETLGKASEGKWDGNKKQALHSFMNDWGESMGQSYQEYTETQSVMLGGSRLPKELLDGSLEMVTEGDVITLEWSENGIGDYQLVSVYGDVISSEQHVYLFVLHQGKPLVWLVDGAEDGELSFQETQNGQLKEGFAQIVIADS